MKSASIKIKTDGMAQASGEIMNETPKFDLIAKGVVTGVAATIIVESGKGAIGTLAKNPLAMFGLGLVTGYFAHKYRKEIISVSSKTTEQGKDYLLRQKEYLREMLTESQEIRATSRDSN